MLASKAKKITDTVTPFSIDDGFAMGRYAHLENTLSGIINRHTYPDSLNKLLAELILAGSLLASVFKYEKKITLQVKGDDAAPLNFAVVEINTAMNVRACIKIADPYFFEKPTIDQPLQSLLGKGFLVLSLDQGTNTTLYQGVVELKGKTLSQAFNHYFQQSDQTPICMSLITKPPHKGKSWQGIGILLNKLPESGGAMPSEKPLPRLWQKLSHLTKEALSFSLFNSAPHKNLKKIFNNHNLVFSDPLMVKERCSCSKEKILAALKTFPQKEIETMKDDSNISITCEFCSTNYLFEDGDLS